MTAPSKLLVLLLSFIFFLVKSNSFSHLIFFFFFHIRFRFGTLPRRWPPPYDRICCYKVVSCSGSHPFLAKIHQCNWYVKRKQKRKISLIFLSLPSNNPPPPSPPSPLSSPSRCLVRWLYPCRTPSSPTNLPRKRFYAPNQTYY